MTRMLLRAPRSVLIRRQDSNLPFSSRGRPRPLGANRATITSQEPAYKRIQKALRGRIETGRYGRFRESWKVSTGESNDRATRAGGPVLEGIVECRHSAGTFVAPAKVHFNKLMSYTEQIASGGSACLRVLCFSLIDNEHELAARFVLPPRNLLLKVQRGYGVGLAYADAEVDATAADPRTGNVGFCVAARLRSSLSRPRRTREHEALRLTSTQRNRR
jgi:hypothetical protein